MVILEVIVKPQAKKSKIFYDKDLKTYIIHVQSKPVKNQANFEVIKLTKEFFQADNVKLIKGGISSRKVLEIINPKIDVKK
ncbi:MAG: DUF167 domain-containing protein [Candidatus Thorarchaeota archaeon]